MPPRAEPRETRVAILFDTAGFVRSLALSGAAARTKHLAAHLHAFGMDTTLLLCDLNPDSHPSADWPMPVDYLDYTTLHEAPNRLVQRVRASGATVLMVSNTQLTVRLGRQVADACDCALVYEMHDDEAMVVATTGGSRTEVFEAAQLQQAATMLADAVIALTDRDAATARSRGAVAVHTVGCGVDPGPRPEIAGHARIGGRIVFVGNLYYEPNQRAVRYLHQVLAPALAPLGATVDVYGRYPAALGQELAGSLVRLCGPVPDLRAALAQASIGVAPLDSGGGQKLKVLEYMAAGLAIVGSPEAFAGIPQAREFALVTQDDMSDMVALTAGVIGDDALRADLAMRARQRVESTYAWQKIAQGARRALAEVYPRDRRDVAIEEHIASQARAAPFWLAEWRSRGAHTIKEQRVADYAAPPGRGIVADNAPAIDCARLAAQAELGIVFDAHDAVVGYGERSVLFFAEQAVLKVYTHRSQQRMRRELDGLRAAATRPHLGVPAVLAYAQAPGSLAWVVLGRLDGRDAADDDSAQATEDIARVAARLHTTPLVDVMNMAAYELRLREEPAPTPEADQARAHLAAMLAPVETAERQRCTRGLVHGDFSARNILLTDTDPGVIDFEGAGVGCVYEDLAKLHLNEVTIAGRDEALFAKTYAEESQRLGAIHPSIDATHLYVHLARHLRWVLQWAPQIDPQLTAYVFELVPHVAHTLGRAR